MSLRPTLIQGFDYDLWANLQWLKTIPKMQHADAANGILSHALSAQIHWISRCKGIAPDMQQLSEAALRSVNAQWRDWVQSADLDQVIAYKNLSGIAFENDVSSIARHVINHGTYHRGELRGIARVEQFEDFPETDMITFIRGR